MLQRLKRALGREDDPARSDATRIYRRLMEVSRRPGFYGEGRVPDTFQGRTELLIAHVSVVMKACQQHGENGRLLQQALFDIMRDDFDVALREEGYSDAGVKHRIKPMMKLFYQMVKGVAEALDGEDRDGLVALMEDAEKADGLGKASPDYRGALADYLRESWERHRGLALGELAQARLDFPETPRVA